MNSTILLSTSRSGTTFIDKKLNGMCGHEKGGEIFFENFFIDNEIEHLINCDSNEYNEKTDVKLRDINMYSENCLYTVNKDTIMEMVKETKNVVFNIHLEQIKYNLSLMKKIKTPILFLIRKKTKTLKSLLLEIILVVDPHENMRHGLYWITALKL